MLVWDRSWEKKHCANKTANEEKKSNRHHEPGEFFIEWSTLVLTRVTAPAYEKGEGEWKNQNADAGRVPFQGFSSGGKSSKVVACHFPPAGKGFKKESLGEERLAAFNGDQGGVDSNYF